MDPLLIHHLDQYNRSFRKAADNLRQLKLAMSGKNMDRLDQFIPSDLFFVGYFGLVLLDFKMKSSDPGESSSCFEKLWSINLKPSPMSEFYGSHDQSNPNFFSAILVDQYQTDIFAADFRAENNENAKITSPDMKRFYYWSRDFGISPYDAVGNLYKMVGNSKFGSEKVSEIHDISQFFDRNRVLKKMIETELRK